ncbi:cytochrome C [Rhodospirillum rubrum]|nr:cytochrome C [Rhodospirillum rubrum]
MARFALPCLALMGVALVHPPARAEDPAASLKTEAAGLVKTYSTTLLTALQDALDSGGPVLAIEACHAQAGPIAADLAAHSGWSIKRTSLKLRNPASAPDAFERETLAAFEDRLGKGEAIADLTRTAIVKGPDGRETFRFAKAIPLGQACTTCHGVALTPEVTAKLHDLYPEDQAVGFKPGDLRGIFSLSRPM